MNSIDFRLAVLSETFIALLRVLLLLILALSLLVLLFHHLCALLDDLGVAVAVLILGLALHVGAIVFLFVLVLLLLEVEEAGVHGLGHEGRGRRGEHTR